MSLESPELSPEVPGAAARAGGNAGRRLLYAAFTLTVLVGILVAARGMPWRETWRALTDARPAWIAAAFLLNVAQLPLWASQWRFLAPPGQCPSWRRMFAIVSTVSLTQNVLPFIGGPITAAGLLVLRGGMTRGGAVSVIALDQMLTGLGKLAALALAAAATPMPAWLRDGTWSFTAVVAAMLFGLVILARATSWLDRRAARHRLIAHLADWTRHLSGLRRLGGPVWWGFFYALLKKTCEVLAALAIQRACGIELGWSAATLAVAALGLSTLLRTPGNLGIYEATVVAIYGALGVPAAPALAAALLQHLMSLAPRFGAGSIALALSRR
ncbi:MAG TPA: lysylphosphatidylglycerol synthase transmembrane domain-containing protein [Stellaceae bacterium]|nr:lysylphosphatidylglycerol synthase transmembrane domain-containing protein [Stellaceae bacterium]